MKAQNPKTKAPSPKINLLFCAGDVSGDIHAALLVRAILSRHPDWTIHALGGNRLRAVGAHIIGDTSGLGVIGFASALALLPRVLKLRSATLSWLKTHHIDGVVLCDWGAFNARLLPDLRALNIPVLYYFPPRSWQKHGDGGLNIAPLVNRVATPFEWSANRLRVAGCNAEWVGHPLLETTRASKPRDELRAEFGLMPPNEILVALLPGSRRAELKLIAPQLNQAARILKQQSKHALRFAVAAPPNERKAVLRYFERAIPVVENRAADLLLACDIAVVKSGTATLEAAVADAPQVVVYDVPPLLRAQWKLTGLSRRVPFVAMPNIILERALVPELLGDDCRAARIADEVNLLLKDEARREAMRNGYTAVRCALGNTLPLSATLRTAQILEEMLAERRAEVSET